MSQELKYPVITIGREYCAYGRTIAAALSAELGIPYYDKDFIKETAKQSGYSEEAIQEEGEQMDRMSKLVNTLINGTTLTSSYDKIYNAQKEVIIKLAKEEAPCILVGRCADYILGKRKDVVHVFVMADMEFRKELYDNKDKYIGKIIQVGYREITVNGKFRFPRLVRLRLDKDYEDLPL